MTERLALRTTVEGFSAGTRIQFESPVTEESEWPEVITLSAWCDPTYMFDVKTEDVVILRSREVKSKDDD